MTTSDAPVLPRPASTTVLLRQGAPFEVFLIKRVASQRFMGGSHVFPGGRLDDSDRDVVKAGLIDHADPEGLAKRMLLPTAEEALVYQVAAARELLEEAGVLLARNASHDDAQEMRAAMLDGTAFTDVLRERSLVIDGNALSYLAWWVTPSVEPKRFNARFFIATLPEGQETIVDEQEAVSGEWFEPRNAVAAHMAREIMLPAPTVCVLDGLARLSVLKDAARGATWPVHPIEPLMVTAGEKVILAFPNDPLHPVKQPMPPGAPTRVELRDGIFVPAVVREDA